MLKHTNKNCVDFLMDSHYFLGILYGNQLEADGLLLTLSAVYAQFPAALSVVAYSCMITLFL